MILSHRHRFVFIKGRKVAGTSAEIALSRLCGPGDVVAPILPPDERKRIGDGGAARNWLGLPQPFRRPLERRYIYWLAYGREEMPRLARSRLARFYNHMSLVEVLERAPEADAYQILAVERSPYAKVISLAHWHNRARLEPEALPPAVDRLIASGRIRAVLNISKYRDAQGRLRVEPWHVATLEADLAAFCRSRGLEPVPLAHAKVLAGTTPTDALDILRPDQVRTINDIFAEEFEAFGWERAGEARAGVFHSDGRA